MRNKTVITMVALMIACLALTASAQIRYGQPASGGIKVFYSSWKLEQGSTESTISQLAFPVSAFVPLKDNLEMRFSLANASSNAEFGESDMSLSGLGDARVQFSHSFADDQVLLSAGANLPVGKKSLDTEGQAVLNVLSENFLSFPMRRLGEGFGFNLLVGVARATGSTNLGGGIMYKYNGKYEPYEGIVDYDPGDLLSINGGIDIKSEATTFGIHAVYSIYTDDKLDDRKVFKQSPQLDFRVNVAHITGETQLNGMVRYVMRGDNDLFSSDASEQEVIESLKLFGDELSAGGNIMFPFSETMTGGPVVEYRMIAENDEDLDPQLGDASIFGFGALINARLGTTMLLEVDSKYHIGNADGGDIDITGLQITAGLTTTF